MSSLLLQSILELLHANKLLVAVAIVVVYLVSNVVYLRYFHPLAKFPGPFLASVSSIWRVYHLWSLHMPEKLLALHEEYGPIVRFGPNDLNFYNTDAVQPIYKSGRSMIKSNFYDGFTTFKANLFGNRDEDVHAIRRRQTAHGFSLASLNEMEALFDVNVAALRKKLNAYADSGQPVDLKEVVAFYSYDVIGELAFSTKFNSQEHGRVEDLPPINDHILLGCTYGMLPSLLPWSMKLSKYIPWKWLQGMLASRLHLREVTRKSVEARMEDKIGDQDLLTRLINAKDPETGAGLTTDDVASEAFGFFCADIKCRVAGSHTTSGTQTLLFYHLLHNRKALESVFEELASELPLLREVGAYPLQGLEPRLPYTNACIRENFRMSPVFTMPLPRQVLTEGGVEISGRLIPQGTHVSVENYALHHNANVWGADHNVFKPERWIEGPTKGFGNYLLPFGLGHRACIGRNIAMMNVMKLTTTLLRNYNFEAADPKEELVMESVGIGEKKGPLMVKVSKKQT
ncbi:Cytochrome P450 [Hyphodiscus hymeniophilus]|uniref:Cytochrome P450 n=1 Tax=Hyphodiscus hymeniophilus TaxID=353542 RepID=A0A9P7B130_9HELO|nr:Cytochrome P450 [Hyphodiscus hymeniophilus]